jgi:hypothetical protein
MILVAFSINAFLECLVSKLIAKNDGMHSLGFSVSDIDGMQNGGILASQCALLSATPLKLPHNVPSFFFPFIFANLIHSTRCRIRRIIYCSVKTLPQCFLNSTNRSLQEKLATLNCKYNRTFFFLTKLIVLFFVKLS